MRALITGAAGFVGSHLAEYLLDHTDWDVTGLMRWNDPTDNLDRLIPYANRDERVSFVYGDLRDATSIRHAVQCTKPDYVFHLGAQSFPLTSFSAAHDTFETNVQGTLNLLEAVKDHAPPTALVHVCSSSEVYGRVTRDRLPIAEDCPFAPASPYSISKVAADLLGQHYADRGLRVLVTRMFTHTGPRRGDVFAESSFAKQIAMIEAGQIEPVIRVGNLNSLRTVADVRDAVRAYHMLLTVNPVPGSVFNIGGAHTCTVGEILDALLSFSTVRARIEVDPARLRPVDADLQVPDCSRFKRHTGWEPRLSFWETMRDLLDYWRHRVRLAPQMVR